MFFIQPECLQPADWCSWLNVDVLSAPNTHREARRSPATSLTMDIVLERWFEPEKKKQQKTRKDEDGGRREREREDGGREGSALSGGGCLGAGKGRRLCACVTDKVVLCKIKPGL